MSDSEPGRRGKVEQLIEKHDLEGIGDRLERRWTANGEERKSLRDLADEFNRELLRVAMIDAEMQPLDGAVENVYRLLTDDDVSTADRKRAQRRLDREDVDVDQLQQEFVTYQAIRTYLREHRGASYSGETRDRTESEKEHIQRLRGRVQSVTNSKLAQLQRNGDIDLGSFRTLVEVNVLCEDCGTQYAVETLLDNGGCDCVGSDE
ncbi:MULTISPECIES: rod-determining factor RdfA [Halolamina]|nr:MULTISPECIES: rod-determining factor RdfA [Halolamina]NHX37465.1 hypothetical protein [Halolamina sp. R1-12]